MENKTDCGQKCFELQDTEHALAVEKENNQKLQAEIKRLTALIEKMKCCENSTTTLSGEFISCSLQEEKAALQEAVDKLEAKNKEMHDKITDIIECFISVSSKDDIELSGAAMEIAEILDIKLFR